jgi:CRP-like cAMP-binding protein
MNLKELVDTAPEHIREKFIHRKHENGSFIIHPDEENDYLYVLINGSAEVYRQSYAGTMLSLYIYNPYSCFGEVEIFNKEFKTLGVIAKTDCETLAIHKNDVYEWMRFDFNLTFYIIEQLSAKLISSSDTAAKLSLLKVKDRILCSMLAHYKIGDLDKLTKQNLSIEVCTPIRSLNRSVSECIAEGYIDFKDKKFTVNSIVRLEKYLEDFLY